MTRQPPQPRFPPPPLRLHERDEVVEPIEGRPETYTNPGMWRREPRSRDPMPPWDERPVPTHEVFENARRIGRLWLIGAALVLVGFVAGAAYWWGGA
jgi:hypothetical protein